jgi:hypothetical protein
MKTIEVSLLFLISGLFISTPTLWAAENAQHAPALQACEADFDLWASQIPGFPNLEHIDEGTKSVTVKEMATRVSSLNDCTSAYPALNESNPGQLSAFTSLIMIYTLELQSRYSNFLDRHDLKTKFLEEDAAGER